MAPGLQAEALQLAKLFFEDLEGEDPFYIPGNDWGAAKEQDQGSYINNFVDIANADDFEELLDGLPGAPKPEVRFNRFHELPMAKRLAILYYLC